MYYSTQDLLSMHGINMLTGEADKYSMRILCDLNTTGVETISTFFGINPVTGTFNENWNRYVHDKEAVASFMLPRGTIQELCKFVAFHYMNSYVFCESGLGYDILSKDDYDKMVAVYGEEKMEHINKKLLITARAWRNYNHREDRTPISDRNEHQMSGRVV